MIDLLCFSSSPTTYSIRKNRITKLIEKYSHSTSPPDGFFHKMFFLSTNEDSMTTIQM